MLTNFSMCGQPKIKKELGQCEEGVGGGGCQLVWRQHGIIGINIYVDYILAPCYLPCIKSTLIFQMMHQIKKFNAILIPRREIFYISYSFIILILGYKYTSYFLDHHFCLFKRGWSKFHSNLWGTIFYSKHTFLISTKNTDMLGQSLAKLQRASKYFFNNMVNVI